MKELIFFILIGFVVGFVWFAFDFSDTYWSETNKREVFIIDEIKVGIGNQKHEAEYWVTSYNPKNRADWSFTFSWIDSIGKFEVGDTLILIKKPE